MQSRLGRYYGPLAALLPVALFLAFWWNRCLGITLDGYFPLYGARILHGDVPYRDFFLYVPPLVPLEDAAIWAFFGGPQLTAPRLLGVLTRLLLVALLYRWLRRHASPGVAGLAAAASAIVSAGDTTDVLLLYNFESLLFAVLSGWLAARSLDDDDGAARRDIFFSGFAAALCLLAKQTIGLAVTLAMPAAWALAAWGRSRPRIPRRLAIGFAGWSLPIGVTLAALARGGALRPFFEQTFLQGTAMKGPLAQQLLRIPLAPFEEFSLSLPFLLGIGAAAITFLLVSAAGTDESSPPRLPLGSVLGLGVVTVTLGGVAGLTVSDARIGILRLPQRSAVYFALAICVGLAVVLTQRALARRLTPADGHLLIQATIGLAAAIALGLSWGFNEAMAMPALAVAIAWLAGAPARSASGAIRLRWVVTPLLGVTFLFATWAKLAVPYDFAYWREPRVAKATVASGEFPLAGLRLSASSARTLDEMVAALRGASRDGDRLLAIPDLPILNLLADRHPTTFAMVHWFDVCPDEVVRADTARVLADPPELFAVMELQEQDFREHEMTFRAGGRAALRDLYAAVHELTAKRYRQIGRFASAGYQRPITLWARVDPVPDPPRTKSSNS
jgi:hypothetical protein